MLDDCHSIAASTDEILWSDDDTIVADMEGVWHEDLAAIRRLLDAEGGGSTCCPSCEMPFDKGKKRRLIDTCGHERCYTCMFTNEVCPLCNIRQDPNLQQTQIQRPAAPSPAPMGRQGLRGSEITLYGESGCPPTATRPKVKTNGHFTTFMQSRQDLTSSGSEWPSPTRLPKTRPSNPKTGSGPQQLLQQQQQDAMSQSCPTPTPPQGRRRFFLSPKALRSPFSQRASGRQQRPHEAMSASATDVVTVTPPIVMTASACSEGGGRGWPSVVLGKIRSLWSASGSTTGAGLNQLADDEGGSVKPTNGSGRKSSQNDLYMRLGLLLGDGARRRAGRAASSRSNTATGTHESCSSLASYDTAAMMSTNTSPVSTLTGSSEDPHRNNPSSDSVGSLMSMSMSGQSNCSSSPVSRRHSVTTTQAGQVEDLGMFRSRRTCVRRSARTGTVKGPVDPKIRFAQYRTPQLTLKPLFFEVPLQEPDPLFVGRQWLIREMEDILESTNPGVLLSGNPGTGKTALVLQLVEYSCFGRRKESQTEASPPPEPHHQHQVNLTSERMKQLASEVVAYHFCQADNNSTCLVPDFVHSLAAQLCQAPQLVAYRDQLLGEPHLQGVVSLKECIADPDLAFSRGILEPLAGLRRLGKIENRNCIILVDALCEAEYHRPDTGDTIASFLAKHASAFPSWLKIIATVRTQLLEIVKRLPYSRLSLDKAGDNSNKDLLDYIGFRLNNSPSIQANVTSTPGKPEGNSQYRFAHHLVSLSQGSFLFAKLTLDLLERGHLVAKSSGYKVLPVSLAQIFLLHFNLRFPTVRSFEKVCHILSVCLSALYPLTLLEIYYSVNSLLVDQFLPWEEFLQRFKLLSGFLVKRLDNTYMFFHPSFREWLIRRDENESTKFVCDLRAGHAAIAFRLSRVQAPLDADKTLELGHHILKAHVYRNVPGVSSRDLQAHWVASNAQCTSSALCSLRNIYSPNVKVSRLLLLAGASPDHTTEFLGDAPVLCMFAHEGVVPMISLLLEFGADVELTNSQGSTALSLASARGHCDVVRQLIAAGASPGHADTGGRCALVHAARNGRLNVVGYLLACDWVPTPTGSGEKEESDVSLAEAAQQALVAAAAHGHAEVVEYLLDMAEVNADTPDTLTGETALTVAAANGCAAVISALVGRGADPSVPNRREVPPLLVAAREGHWAVAERLLQARAPLEQCESAGRTALSLAAAEGHVGIIELLLDKGATIDRQDRDGLTALCWACVRGRVQAAQCLLDRNADIAHSDKTGRTPLDLAAFQGGAALVQLLLDRGALIEHVDINGMRPLDRAIGCRNIQVVQCFLRKGAKLGPATWAMAAGKPDIMLILLNKLLEDGNVLYRKSRLKEAAHRYQYALKKFPTEEAAGNENIATFHQLRINFLLNQSRCKRKMNETDEAIELADQVLVLRPDSYEAYYARAKAHADAGMYDAALFDVREALRLTPAGHAHGPEVRRVLCHLRDEISARMSRPGVHRRELAASVDTLNEH